MSILTFLSGIFVGFVAYGVTVLALNRAASRPSHLPRTAIDDVLFGEHRDERSAR